MEESLIKQQELYDETWRKGLEAGIENRGNLQTNLEFLAEIKLLKANDKILEIGCGTGRVVFELNRQRYDVIGTDISREAIAYGLKKYNDIKLQVQPAEKLEFTNETFDVVLSFDLFEHIAEVDKHISEVYRVLRPNGLYLFQTPNKYFNAVFATLSNKSLKWRRAHPSLHSAKQLRQRLSRHHFEVRFIKMNPINDFTIKKLQKFGPVSHIFKHINFRYLPMFLQTNLYVIARKL